MAIPQVNPLRNYSERSVKEECRIHYSSSSVLWWQRKHCLTMSSMVAFMIVMLLANTVTAQTDTQQQEAVAGTTAYIPCDVPIEASTTTVLVLWYKKDVSKAVYVFEAKGSLEDASHKLAGNFLTGDRAEFEPLRDPAALRLQQVSLEDETLYTCKVFLGGYSYIYRTNLTVIVPPDKPTIYNSAGERVNLTDVTYNEGATVELTCQVTGGKPSPSVRWYWDKELLDDDHDTVGTRVVRNTLLFGPLTRQHANARMVCHASTHSIVTPLTTVFWLNVQFKPTSVQIISDDSPMEVGETYRLQCQSMGAEPPATLSWWLNGIRLTNDTYRIYNQVPEGANMTLSTLELSPVIQDKGSELQCRARSPVIEHAQLVDTRTLVIHYMGSVKLTVVGVPPDHGVVEGTPVSLRCNVTADPPPDNISWYHKVGSKIQRLPGHEGPRLDLPNVSRNNSGVYTCVASNVVADSHSNPEMLQVNYEPTCQESRLQMVGTGAYEEVKLACKIRSSPDPTSFRWQLKSNGKVIDIPEHLIQVGDQHAILSYTPKTDFDYGTLMCWAKNPIGEQEKPCRFELVSAVLPAALTNCTASNNDTHTVFVDCQGGSDNGLPETFIAEVYDITRDRLLRNVSSSSPMFIIEELDPGSGFTVEVFSSNIRGASEKFTFLAFTEPLVKKTADYSSIHVFPITPILGILVGIVGAVVVMALVVVFIMKLKSSKASHGTKLKCGEPPIMVPVGDRDYNQKYGKGGGKQTLINFPPESPASAPITEKNKSEEASSGPSAPPPPPDVEYAELEFANDKKVKKKRKKTKSKKKKEMKDEEIEYASIDHMRTLQNSQQVQLHEQLNNELKEQQHQLLDQDSKQPLMRVERGGSKGADDRGHIVLPDGALESSV